MDRNKLLNLICDVYPCVDFNLFFNNWLDKYDKHVIEQYKADTNLKDTIKDIHNNVAREMYCKGVDDFVQKVKEHQYVLSDVINSRDYGMFTVGIEQIAEELKAGGENV